MKNKIRKLKLDILNLYLYIGNINAKIILIALTPR